MNRNTQQTITILAFPVVLTIGIVLIPFVSDYNDHQLAEQAVSTEHTESTEVSLAGETR